MGNCCDPQDGPSIMPKEPKATSALNAPSDGVQIQYCGA